MFVVFVAGLWQALLGHSNRVLFVLILMYWTTHELVRFIGADRFRRISSGPMLLAPV
jgi:hypothetical protein